MLASKQLPSLFDSAIQTFGLTNHVYQITKKRVCEHCDLLKTCACKSYPGCPTQPQPPPTDGVMDERRRRERRVGSFGVVELQQLQLGSDR